MACHCGAQTVDVIVIRPATAHDVTFLCQMLAVAADWRPDTPTRSVDEVLAEPELAHYVAGWPLERDVGVVAEDGVRPVGAAWWRFFTAQEGHSTIMATSSRQGLCRKAKVGPRKCTRNPPPPRSS